MNTAIAAKPMRGEYQGVLQIVHFNWRTYLAASMAVCAATAAWPLVSPSVRWLLFACAAPAAFWMAASLAVSHYVYDRFPLYDLRWLERALTQTPKRWINVHAGWDETSQLLQAVFPGAIGEAVDLFDPRVMTEASIRQARRARQLAVPSTPARFDALPFEDGTVDAVFVIFAAHELRRSEQRAAFFGEMARVLTTGGEAVLIEHARDRWNFLAFGPGFLHFFPPRIWREAARQAGLELRSEFAMTPFVRVFVLRRAR